MQVVRSLRNTKSTVAPFLLLIGAYASNICAAQVLDKVSINPTAKQYKPIIASKDTAIRIGSDGSLDAVNLNTESTLWAASALGGRAISAADAQSASLFATLSSDGAIRLWDFSTGRLLRVQPAGKERLVRISLSTDGHDIVALSERGRLTVSDSISGRRITSTTWRKLVELPRDLGTISAMKFIAAGTLLLGTTKGEVYAWNLDRNRAQLVDRVGQEPVTALASAAGSARWASADASGKIYVSDTLDTGHAMEFVSLASLISNLEFDASGDVLLACRASRDTVAVARGKVGAYGAASHESALPCATFGPDSQDVYASDRLGNLRRWRLLQSLSTLVPLSLYPPVAWNVANSSNTAHLFSSLRGTSFGLFWVFRLPSIIDGSMKASAESSTPGIPRQWTVARDDGSLRISYSPLRGLTVTTDSARKPRVVAIPGSTATSCAFAFSTGLDAVIGYADGHVAVLRDGKIAATAQLSRAAIVALTVDALSNSVAVADSIGTIKIWRPFKTKESELIETVATSEDISELRFASSQNDILLVYSLSGIKVVSLKDREIVGNVFATPGLLEWIAVAGSGLFDGPVSLWGSVTVRGQSTQRQLPLNAIVTDFYRPGLIDVLLAGGRPEGSIDLSKIDRRQPIVHLRAEYLSGQPNKPETPKWIIVTVEGEEAPPGIDGASGGGLRDLRLFRNGILVRAWRGDLLLNNGRFIAQTSLLAGSETQHLTAYAFNRHDVKGNDSEIELIAPGGVKKERTLHVLSIGVSRYQSQLFFSPNAERDAREFATTFSESVRQAGVFNNVKLYLLPNELATRRNILLALRRLSGGFRPLVGSLLPEVLSDIEVPGPDDVVVLYYSGHAGLVDGDFFLFPFDAGGDVKEEELLADAIRKSSISENDLSRAVETIDGNDFLLIVDACQSGQLLVSSDPRFGPINAQGFAHLAFEKGMSIIAAAMPQQVALESRHLDHSLLTHALIEGLSKAVSRDSQTPDVLTVEDWFNFAAKRVPQRYAMLFENDSLRAPQPQSTPESAILGYQQPIVFLGKEEKRKFVVHKFR